MLQKKLFMPMPSELMLELIYLGFTEPAEDEIEEEISDEEEEG